MESVSRKRRWDIPLLLGLLAVGVIIGVCLLLTGRSGGAVQVRVAGEIKGTYQLNERQTVQIEGIGGTNLLVIADGSASVTEADCPDALCVNMGKIGRAGQAIVCLPHQVVVDELDGSDENDVDLIVG